MTGADASGGVGAGRATRLAREMPEQGAGAWAPRPSSEHTAMLLTIAIVLAVLWALGFLVFNVAAGVIHLVLALAVIAIIAHFVRRRAPSSTTL